MSETSAESFHIFFFGFPMTASCPLNPGKQRGILKTKSFTVQDPMAGIYTTHPRRPNTHKADVCGFLLHGFLWNFYFCNFPKIQV